MTSNQNQVTTDESLEIDNNADVRFVWDPKKGELVPDQPDIDNTVTADNIDEEEDDDDDLDIQIQIKPVSSTATTTSLPTTTTTAVPQGNPNANGPPQIPIVQPLTNLLGGMVPTESQSSNEEDSESDSDSNEESAPVSTPQLIGEALEEGINSEAFQLVADRWIRDSKMPQFYFFYLTREKKLLCWDASDTACYRWRTNLQDAEFLYHCDMDVNNMNRAQMAKQLGSQQNNQTNQGNTNTKVRSPGQGVPGSPDIWLTLIPPQVLYLNESGNGNPISNIKIREYEFPSLDIMEKIFGNVIIESESDGKTQTNNNDNIVISPESQQRLEDMRTKSKCKEARFILVNELDNNDNEHEGDNNNFKPKKRLDQPRIFVKGIPKSIIGMMKILEQELITAEGGLEKFNIKEWRKRQQHIHTSGNLISAESDTIKSRNSNGNGQTSNFKPVVTNLNRFQDGGFEVVDDLNSSNHTGAGGAGGGFQGQAKPVSHHTMIKFADGVFATVTPPNQQQAKNSVTGSSDVESEKENVNKESEKQQLPPGVIARQGTVDADAAQAVQATSVSKEQQDETDREIEELLRLSAKEGALRNGDSELDVKNDVKLAGYVDSTAGVQGSVMSSPNSDSNIDNDLKLMSSLKSPQDQQLQNLQYESDALDDELNLIDSSLPSVIMSDSNAATSDLENTIPESAAANGNANGNHVTINSEDLNNNANPGNTNSLSLSDENIKLLSLQLPPPESQSQIHARRLALFIRKFQLPSTTVKFIRKLDTQLQRYICHKFKLPAANSKAEKLLPKFVQKLLAYPQRWRLEALIYDGDMDTECETRMLSGEDGDEKVIGAKRRQKKSKGNSKETVHANGNEEDNHNDDSDDDNDDDIDFNNLNLDQNIDQLNLDIELDSDPDFFPVPHKPRSFCGEVLNEHCRVHCLFGYWHLSACEDRCGVIVDGIKIRASLDAPTPLRDGSIIQVGKSLILCEIGPSLDLKKRRDKFCDRVVNGNGTGESLDNKIDHNDSAEKKQTDILGGPDTNSFNDSSEVQIETESQTLKVTMESNTEIQDQPPVKKRKTSRWGSENN